MFSKLIIPKGTIEIDFHKDAFGVIELTHWNNGDGSKYTLLNLPLMALFHLHEENAQKVF